MLDPQGPWRAAIHAGPFDETFHPAHRYDVILMMDVIEHMDRPDQAVRHALELLEPQGHLLVTVPAFSWLWTRHDELNHHLRRYNRRGLRDLLRDAGLVIERERFLFQWVVPAKLLVRMWERVHRAPPRPPSVPVAPVNGLLWAMTRAELAIAMRLPIPFGSSLLMIGRS
jgi:SAM-dependent methyltransferase